MTSTQKTKTSKSGQKRGAGNVKPAAKSSKRKYPVKFDSEGFKLMLFVGLGIGAVGTLIVWASRTAPKGVTSSYQLNNTISRKIVQSMPESVTQWIATILGLMFILFGIFCVVMAFKIVIKYFIEKSKDKSL